MAPDPSTVATGRYAVKFLIAAIIFAVIYVIVTATLRGITGLLGEEILGNEGGYCESVWIHVLVAFSVGFLLFYAPQNPVHLKPMIAVMTFSVFWAGILGGGIWKPTGQPLWDSVKKWRITVGPFSLSYALGWFSAVVTVAYLILELGQWQGVFPATWDVFAVVSDPRVGAALMLPCAYLGATQYVYQIPYLKAGASITDEVPVMNIYQAAADIYDHLPPETDVSRRVIETTLAARVDQEGSFDAAHRITAEDYLNYPDLNTYLVAHNLTKRASAATNQTAPSTKSNRTPPKSSEHEGPTDQLNQYEYDWLRSDVTFDDIGGYYNVKQALSDEVIKPLQAAAKGDDRFERFDIEPERGILFYGPPGTGKTMFARALAGELGVPFVELSPADVTSKWINEGPDRVQDLFAEADQLAPCVVFLDEAEHLFGGRDTTARTAHAEDRKITSEFLVQLAQQQKDVVVVSATNRPGDIDPAILRPGRLATHYEVGLPDEETRHAILETKLDEVPSDLTADELATIAAQTRGFSGADLEDLVDDAKRAAATRDAEAITRDDFPSGEQLKAMAADRERATPSEVLPDPEEDSSLVTSDAEGDNDRDHSVGYQ